MPAIVAPGRVRLLAAIGLDDLPHTGETTAATISSRRMGALDTRRIAGEPDAIAPDGSAVRILCATSRGGMAAFTLAPGAVSRAVAHRTVEEIWYFVVGSGRMWRKLGDQESVADVEAGVSIAIPTGAHFQFRCDGATPLIAVAATMPPWPGGGEAYAVEGPWPPTV